LRYFGRLREDLQNIEQEKVTWHPELNKLIAVKQHLLARGEPWQSALSAADIAAAVNQQMAEEDTPVNAGDEIAFFPPMTGG